MALCPGSDVRRDAAWELGVCNYSRVSLERTSEVSPFWTSARTLAGVFIKLIERHSISSAQQFFSILTHRPTQFTGRSGLAAKAQYRFAPVKKSILNLGVFNWENFTVMFKAQTLAPARGFKGSTNT